MTKEELDAIESEWNKRFTYGEESQQAALAYNEIPTLIAEVRKLHCLRDNLINMTTAAAGLLIRADEVHARVKEWSE